MPKQIHVITILMVFFLSQAAVAINPEQLADKQNFAFSADISPGTQSIRQFELPYQVLKGIQRQDYGDLRIFNSQNQPVPFSVKVNRPQAQQQYIEHELAFFTLPENPQPSNHLQIEIDEFISHFMFSLMTKVSDKLSYIFIKNPHNDIGLNKLRLFWKNEGHAFSLKLKLEQSDDLEHWQTVRYKTTLYDLKHDSMILIKDSIIFTKPGYAKFLRISFGDQHDFLHSVAKITGYYHFQNQPELENWKMLTMHKGEMAQEWLFSTESVAPIVKMAFEIPQTGLMYQGTLFSKPSLLYAKQVLSNKSRFKKEVKKILHNSDRHKAKQKEVWRFRQGFSQYRLLTEVGEISSQPIVMPIIKDKQWRIVFKQPLMLLPEQIPKINIAWYPVVLTFLAQGNEPYRLFYGNSNIGQPKFGLINQAVGGQAETVQISKVISLKNTVAKVEAMTLSGWFKQMNLQIILLWFFLCLFVLLMAMMAYKLYARMNQE